MQEQAGCVLTVFQENRMMNRNMDTIKGLIFDIQRNCFADGPGIRTTIFFKGCNLRCRWCHNPESQDAKIVIVTDKERCTGCGVCREACPTGAANGMVTCAGTNTAGAIPDGHGGLIEAEDADKAATNGHAGECILCGRCVRLCPSEARIRYGKWYTIDQVVEEVLRDKDFYETSGGGVTCSGGECLLQPDFLKALLSALKAEGIRTAVDTAGCVEWPVIRRMLPVTDLFLYDVKCLNPERHLAFTGQDNRLILDNLRRLSKEFAGDIIIRVPVVRGFNDDPEELLAIASLARECGAKDIEYLPYHAMGQRKYRMLGRDFERFQAPDTAMLDKVRAEAGEMFGNILPNAP